MFKRSFAPVVLAVVAVALGGGCKKSPPGETGQGKSAPPPPVRKAPVTGTAARIHWLGKKQLAADTNAASLMEIWNLPETVRVEGQTLGKLAAFPTRFILGRLAPGIALPASIDTNALSATIRPLLDDVLQQESYLEATRFGDHPDAMALAIKLEDARASLWETNLTSIFPRPADSTNAQGGWIVAGTPFRFEIARAKEWTVVGLALTQNPIMTNLLGRIERAGVPFETPATNGWLEGEIDFGLLATNLPKVTIALSSAGESVRTRGEMDFPEPLPFKIEPWVVPTNFISDPLCSFTALQGIQNWVSTSKPWKDLGAPPFPNQVYVWSMEGVPFLTAFAAPTPNASNIVDTLSKRLLQKANPALEKDGIGHFEPMTNAFGVAWTDMTIMFPNLQAGETNWGSYLLGGLLSPPRGAHSPPPELFQQLYDQTNLVYYSWEMTGQRIEHWLYFAQFIRYAVRKAQIPPQSASVAWLRALELKLGNCVTRVFRTAPNQLSFTRNSSMGATAAELHFLADWLESPKFPEMLNTFASPPDPIARPRSRAGTNTTTSAQPATTNAPAASDTGK